MTEAEHREAFESRLKVLGLLSLTEHDRARLWKTYLTFLKLSAGFDAQVAPATEPMLCFRANEAGQ
jgi:hypothetical protein